MRCEIGPLLTVGAVLAALLARVECILRLTKLPWQPSAKFVNWKCRMSFMLLPFESHEQAAVTSGLDFVWFMLSSAASETPTKLMGAQISAGGHHRVCSVHMLLPSPLKQGCV